MSRLGSPHNSALTPIPALQPPETLGLSLLSHFWERFLGLVADSYSSHNLLAFSLPVGPKEQPSIPVDKCRVKGRVNTAVLQPRL